MSIRETKEYKEMTTERLGKLTYTKPDSEAEALAFWQKLVDIGWERKLGGFYGRTANELIEAGVIEAREE